MRSTAAVQRCSSACCIFNKRVFELLLLFYQPGYSPLTSGINKSISPKELPSVDIFSFWTILCKSQRGLCGNLQFLKYSDQVTFKVI